VKSSHAEIHKLKDDLIGRTPQVWQPRLGRDLSHEDTRQIAAKTDFFSSVLADWSRAEIPSPANDIDNLNASEDGEARHDR
jgi:hypothetical protein